MSKTKPTIKRKLTQTQSYIAGFIFSIILTIIPYIMVVRDLAEGDTLLFALMGYATIQFCVQLYFFLHLGAEPKPRWNLLSMIFILGTILIISIGTLWIMKNLNYNMMYTDPKTTEQNLLKDQNYIKDNGQVDDHNNNQSHGHNE